MESASSKADLRNSRGKIASRVRSLRKARLWTQADLAQRIGVSQARLSQLERGTGSFTAEQFLVILKLFNVDVTHFAPRAPSDHDRDVQNALARLGASHLRESDDVLPSKWLADLSVLVHETLLAPSPRLLAALAPVLVRNIDRINLRKLHADLADVGLERRLAWLVDNTFDALRSGPVDLPRTWARQCRRAAVVLDEFRAFVISYQQALPLERLPTAVDVLDSEIRSKKSLDAVKAASSLASRRWGIVTRLQPDDFLVALRSAHADR